MTMYKQHTITIQDCLDNPTTIYVFGDNMIAKGKAGQAAIRNCRNSFGISTKRLPSMAVGSFYSDKQEEINLVYKQLLELYNLSLTHDIVFPSRGLGTGLAKMNMNSPIAFDYMNQTIKSAFGIEFNK